MNYIDTFIAVAADTRATAGRPPPARAGKPPTMAQLQFELVAPRPYQLTQEQVLIDVHLLREGVPSALLAQERARRWDEFFSRSMACLRTSPLAKSYGWGLHFNSVGLLALVPVESPIYRSLAADRRLTQTRAMSSKRAASA